MNSLRLAIKLEELAQQYQRNADYCLRVGGDIQDAIAYEAQEEAITEVFHEVWGYQEHQAIRERAQDIVWQRREAEKNV